MSDQDLLGQCDVHTYRASGPGGQHRNKVSSAVRLRHRPTGITAHGDDSRSQHDNRRLALRRLRMSFACQLRDQVDLAQPRRPPAWADFLARGAKLPGGVRGAGSVGGGRLIVSPNNERFWPIAAHLLDVLEACQGRLADAAAVLGVTGSNLTKVLASDPRLLTAATAIRKRFGLGAIR